jgi:hypothetical protein
MLVAMPFSLHGCRVLAAVTCALALVLPARSQAEPCGTVVAAGTTLALSGNVGPCPNIAGTAAVVVEDGATLDLGPFYVACSETDDEGTVSDGIRVNGSDAAIRNGSVYFCRGGVVLAGGGRHEIENVSLYGNTFGVHVEAASVRNALAAIAAYGDTESTAFFVEGDKTTLEDCLAWQAGTGFLVLSDRNRIVDSLARDALYGFDVAGENNKINRGTAVENGIGIRSRGEGSTVRETTLSNNVDEGLDISASTRVKSSSFTGNDVGVHVRSGLRVKVLGNIAAFNTTFDMVDDAAGCGSHKWIDNIFEVSNQACIE